MKERHKEIERNFANEIRALADVDLDFNFIEYHTDQLLKKADEKSFTDYSFINELRVINYTSEDYKNLTIKFVFESNNFSMDDITGLDVSARSDVKFSNIPSLIVKKSQLSNIIRKEESSFDVVLMLGDNILYKDHHTFTILPSNEPTTALANDIRLLSKYVNNTPFIVDLATKAFKVSSLKKIKSYGKGYTTDNLLEKLNDLYLFMQDMGISLKKLDNNQFVVKNEKDEVEDIYNLIPFEDIINNKEASSYDLALLMASILKAIDLHPIIFETNNHAYLGVFTKEDVSFNLGLETNFDAFYNKAFKNDRDIIVLDPETVTKERKTTIKFSLESADEKIKTFQGAFNAIDIATCHKGSYAPIDISLSDSDFNKQIKCKAVDPLKDLEITNIKVLKSEEKDRFTFWEKKLLDLNESNPLVNIRLKENNCVKLIAKKNIIDLVSTKDSLKAKIIDEKLKYEELFLTENINFTDFESSTDFDDEKVGIIGLDKTLTTLIKKSNSAMDETGSPTLYMCIGRLEYTRKKSNQTGYAPFMVLPIRITKDKVGKGYTISYDYEDLMVNQSFFEYYKMDHPDVNYDELFGNLNGIDYKQIVGEFIAKKAEGIILYSDEVYIENLTFSHYIMWMDVRKRKDELKKNKVIESIIENKNCLEQEELNIEKIDDAENYADFAAPLPYDSTQLKAILDCGKGNSFILDGPPGTGKSQTIVNMIVNAFYHGKTVLFVAEKKAALDVVADRLEKISLGRFCLELHSNKANKGDFFNKLKESMELGSTKNPEDFVARCEEIAAKKKELVETINKMHNKKYYMSLYDSIVSTKYLDMIEYHDDLNLEYLANFNETLAKEINEDIDKYIALIEDIDDYENNPLKMLNLTDINYQDKDKTIKEFSNVLNEYKELLKSVDELFKNIDVEIIKSNLSISYIVQLMDLAFDKPLYLNRIAEFMNIKNDEVNKLIFTKTKEINDLENKNKDIYLFDKLNQIQADIAINEIKTTTGFFKKGKVNKKWIKALKNVIVKGYKLNKKELINYLEFILKYNDLSDYIVGNSKELDKLIGLNYVSNMKNVDEIELSYHSTKLFIELVNKLEPYGAKTVIMNYFLDLAQTKKASLKMSYAYLVEELNKYKALEKELNNKYHIDFETLQKSSDDLTDYRHLLEKATEDEAFSDIVKIASLNRLGNKLVDNGLGNILSNMKLNKFSYADLRDVFELSLANGFIKLYLNDDKIDKFNNSSFEDDLKKYKDLINTYTNLVIEEVSAKLTKDLNHNSINYAQSSPIGRLKKAISSNGRGVTIRDTLLNYDEIIRSYFPCFLMSPLSAAQYLAVDEANGKSASKFDLVIFDEASQIPTHEAIGPIARGSALIVAGDPEQMPPSAYFSAGLELEGEDVEFEDAVSLLDECIAIELPRHRLSYHYRSRHESLIEFSNKYFYNSNLYTFPSPNTKSSMIDFKYVDLKENKADSSITKEEIDAILDTIKEIYTNPKTLNKSLGIIVFNIKQQEKVEEAIAEMLYKNKALRETINQAEEKNKENLFVKSLENVQGDERDIIIISIGFRKSTNGNPFINGPLARENGQRRLNVAVSRSKEQMIIISTIKYSDFTTESKSKSKGPQLLKEFLKFAEESSFNRIDSSKTKDRSIVYYIKKDLEKLGYDASVNVGNSIYRVDLAIKNPDKTKYDLGVLIDTNPIYDDISCRDKFYVQPVVLNGLKWNIINIYSIEYYKEPKKVIDKIIKSLSNPIEQIINEIKPNIQKSEEVVVGYKSKIYKKTTGLKKISYDNENGFSKGIDGVLSKVIETEYPISINTIRARVLSVLNTNTLSAKAKSRLDEIVNDNYKNISYGSTGKFYWINDVKTDVEEFRTNSELALDDIAPEEIACAMVQVADIQGAISKEDLFKLTLQALQPKSITLTAKAKEILDHAYNYAVDLLKIKDIYR